MIYSGRLYDLIFDFLIWTHLALTSFLRCQTSWWMRYRLSTLQ